MGQLVLILLLVGAIIFVVVKNSSSSPRHPDHLEEATWAVDADPQRTIRDVSLAIAPLRKHVARAGPGETLFVDREYYKSWRVLVAILLFPIGLLALTARDRRTMTVVVHEGDDDLSCLVSIAGEISDSVVSALDHRFGAADVRTSRGQRVSREVVQSAKRGGRNPTEALWLRIDEEYGEAFQRSLGELTALLDDAGRTPESIGDVDIETMYRSSWMNAETPGLVKDQLVSDLQHGGATKGPR